jgi:hypothetical protein
MKHFKVIKGRLAVFHAKYQEKTGSGLLYRAHIEDYTLSGTQWVWVYRAGPDCRYKFNAGDKVLIEDGLVLTDSAPNNWQECRDLPEFKDLREMEEKLGLSIQCKIMFEGACLAIDDKAHEN